MNIYRPLISTEQYKAFENAFQKALTEVDTTPLGFVGLLGSMQKVSKGNADAFGHDIDILFFPTPTATTGDLMKISSIAQIVTLQKRALQLAPQAGRLGKSRTSLASAILQENIRS
jgi:hypothetical protein